MEITMHVCGKWQETRELANRTEIGWAKTHGHMLAINVPHPFSISKWKFRCQTKGHSWSTILSPQAWVHLSLQRRRQKVANITHCYSILTLKLKCWFYCGKSLTRIKSNFYKVFEVGSQSMGPFWKVIFLPPSLNLCRKHHRVNIFRHVTGKDQWNPN